MKSAMEWRMMENTGTAALLEELANRLDQVKVVSISDSVLRSGKYSKAADARPAGGLMAMLDPPSQVVGSHRGRTISIKLHSASELKMTISCDAPCRFRITHNNLAARLNLLGGRRVESGIQDFDDRFIIRSQGVFNLSAVFERSDVTGLLPALEPFFQLAAEPGTMALMSNVGPGTDLRAEDMQERLEHLIEFAHILEESSSDACAMEGMREDSVSNQERAGQ